MTDLDEMFGIVTVQFDTAVLKVRRVLNRQQARTISDVVSSSAKMQLSIADVDFTQMSVDEQETMAHKMEDDIANDLVRGCRAALTNADELMLDEWSIASLTQLFQFLRSQTSKMLTDAMTAQFPPSGSRA
jgi:chromosome condensin MukBEF complex kleisin-like MukF subunit